MDATVVKGKEILIKQTPVLIFNAFSDLRNFLISIPDDMRDKVVADKDTISAEVKGIKLGVRVDQRIPFSLVSLQDDGQSPFKFGCAFHLQAVGLDSTLFHLELCAELDFMTKMLVGNKLQDLVDKLTEQIEKAVSGQMPDMSDLKPEDFS